MHLFSHYGPYSRPRFIAAAALALPFAHASGQQIDTARALSALRDARTACEADAGALWKRSLCGPIALVDRQTRLVIANDTVAGKTFPATGRCVRDDASRKPVRRQHVLSVGRPHLDDGRAPAAEGSLRAIALVMHEVFSPRAGGAGSPPARRAQQSARHASRPDMAQARVPRSRPRARIASRSEGGAASRRIGAALSRGAPLALPRQRQPRGDARDPGGTPRVHRTAPRHAAHW